MNSRNKSLLVISVGPKTAPSRLPDPLARTCPRTSRPVALSRFSLCSLASSEQRASSEQQRSKVGFPIRRFPDQSLFAAPRDLSQRTTSFIASQRQGIHQIPLWHLIALIAKARFFAVPDRQSATNALWREKTSFASNASGDLSGQAW